MQLEQIKEELFVLQSSLIGEGEMKWEDESTQLAWEPVLADAAPLSASLPLPTLSLRLADDMDLTVEYRAEAQLPDFSIHSLVLGRVDQERLRHELEGVVERVREEVGPFQLKTTLLWSHHLLATSKRKDIVAWSTELGLYGLAKPGYPGVIIVEGIASNVDEFVHRIKQLQWKALQVRCELDGPLVDAPAAAEGVSARDAPAWAVRRRSHLGPVLDPLGREKVCVKEVEGLNEVGEIMRAAGLEDVFLTALKLNK
ncbi:hypothetical protein JCM10450v2_000253 [Rhodotorula kratochvilovae]